MTFAVFSTGTPAQALQRAEERGWKCMRQRATRRCRITLLPNKSPATSWNLFKPCRGCSGRVKWREVMKENEKRPHTASVRVQYWHSTVLVRLSVATGPMLETIAHTKANSTAATCVLCPPRSPVPCHLHLHLLSLLCQSHHGQMAVDSTGPAGQTDIRQQRLRGPGPSKTKRQECLVSTPG